MASLSSIRAVVALATLALGIQGCASGRVPASQTVRIETPRCSPMTCELRNDVGSWQLPSTPGTVLLTPTRSPLRVSCRDEHGARSTLEVAAQMAPTTGAGGVIGGAVGGAATAATFGTAALTFIPVLGAILVVTGLAAGAVAGHAIESGAKVIAYPTTIVVPPACPADEEAISLGR